MGLLGKGAAQRDAGGCLRILVSRVTQVDISRQEQRVLHLLAQGGVIEPLKDKRGRIEKVVCVNRDGVMLPAMDITLFKKLKRRHTIASHNGGPYRITRRGVELVRAEVDNRG
jgi:uncharacterized protein